MRLTTLGQFNSAIDAFSKQSNQITRLQTEVATGKKILKGSDDPIASSRLKNIDSMIQNLNGFTLNSVLAESRTRMLDDTMQETTNHIQRVQELIQQAQNDTYNDGNRASIAQELQSNLDALLKIANKQDSEGNYIFSGMNTKTPPYLNNGTDYPYQGSQQVTVISIGINTHLTYNEAGSKIFSLSQTDNLFQAIQASINVLNQPTATESDKMNLHQELTTQSTKIQNVFNQSVNYIAEIGARSQRIDDELNANKNKLIDLKVISGRLSDADLSEVISDLTQRLTGLEATQRSYITVQEVYARLLNMR